MRKFARHEVIQFVEYMIGGSAYFWSGYVVFAICYSGFGWRWWPAKMLADAVGWTLNYLIQRYWVFSNPRLARKEKVVAGKYTVLTAINFGLDYALIGGLKALGISPYIGFFISAGFFTVWNYAWYRFWVFLAQGHDGGALKSKEGNHERLRSPHKETA